MMSFFKASALRTLIVVLLSVTAFSSHAQVAASEDGKSWTVNIRNADIQAFISQIADMTGKNFVVDPRVRARDVTVVSTKALSAAEVYELFLSVLQVHGYAAVPSGDIIKIVPNTTAKQSNLPLVGKNAAGGEALVTRVIPVENSPVEELVPVLRPLVPQYGHLAAVGSANALIISDHMDNIRRMEAIIASLDNAESEDVQVIKLEHAFAGDMVKMLESLTPQTGGRRGKTKDGGVTVVADERTNSVLVSGESKARDRIIKTIKGLDTDQQSTGNTRVVYLQYAKAKDLVDVLQGVSDTIQAEDQKGDKGATRTASNGRQQVSIKAHEETNALVITGQPDLINNLVNVVKKLDIRRAQVHVEAMIVEIYDSDGTDLGVQWFSSKYGAQQFSNGSAPSLTTTESSGPAHANSEPLALRQGWPIILARVASSRPTLRRLWIKRYRISTATERETQPISCHCEERSDVAISVHRAP